MSRSCHGNQPASFSLRTLLTVILLGLTATSCARSPQVVFLSPQLAGPPDRIAEQRSVELSLRDDRSTRIIGSRGGLYAETSTISTEDDISPGLTELLAEKLEQQGFTVVPPGSGGEVKLSVDATLWSSVKTVDGLLDSKAETFLLDVSADAELVLIRVMDAAFNTVTYDLNEDFR